MNPNQPVDYNSGSGQRNKIIPIVLMAVVMVPALVFGGWSYAKMQSYKNDTNQKISAALVSAKASQAKQVQEAFDKTNTKAYVGSATYGSVSFNYPKTWSGYVDTASASVPINAYFYPGVVPGIQSKTAYALRLELLSSDYSQVLQQFQTQIKAGKVTARAYIPPKLDGVANVQPGSLLSGAINSSDPTQHVTMLIMKVRDKTLEISTQSNDFVNDFNSIILDSLKFSP